MKKLVITEKFNTALRIAVVLSGGQMNRERIGSVSIFTFAREGDDYTVVGLRGHIVELDYAGDLTRWDMATLPQLLEADASRSITEPSIVAILRQSAPVQDEVILATDWDREGEVIAAEALEILQEVNPKLTVKRAQYSAMTRSDVERAFSDLKELDMNLASAGMARQNVDLMWGALLTRYLTLATRGANTGGPSGAVLSVGRVQTPTLALLVGRDNEIKTFVPQPFWEIEAVATSGSDSFILKHSHGRWFERKEAEAVHAKMSGTHEGRVKTFTEEEAHVRPPIPFSTTLFVAEASRQGLGASHAMRIAEDLYTSGVISYPRTDNTVYPPSLRPNNVLAMLAEGPFAEEAKYCLSQEKIRATRGRFETTDHPPIYPTSNLDIKKASGDKAKVYELVARRYLATVAPDAVGIRRKADVEISGESLVGEGFRLTDRGWYSVYPYMSPRESDLPRLTEGGTVTVTEVRMTEGRTEPPRRYTQGSLIQEMERLGLGTKSTRHEIVQKLVERRYINLKNLEPTTSGLAVVDALQVNAPLVTRSEMTSQLELEMTSIAEGKKSLDDVVDESREMLREVYKLLESNQEGIRASIQGALDRQHFVGQCQLCGGALRIHVSQKGKRWIQCANNPSTCTASYPLPSSGHIEPAKEVCPTCKVPLVRVIHRGQRPQNQCVNPACEAHKSVYLIGTCPTCSSPLRVLYSFRGKRFVGCTGFPNCRVSYPLPQRGRLDHQKAPCESCGAPIITIVEAGRPPWTQCINPVCSTRQPQVKVNIPAKVVSKRTVKASGRKTSTTGRKRSPANSKREGDHPENATTPG